jgi:hypothetical protein
LWPAIPITTKITHTRRSGDRMPSQKIRLVYAREISKSYSIAIKRQRLALQFAGSVQLSRDVSHSFVQLQLKPILLGHPRMLIRMLIRVLLIACSIGNSPAKPAVDSNHLSQR